MKKLAFVVAAASLFAIAPFASRLGAVPSALALVWLGVLLAVVASGSVQSIAIGTGALGALASGTLGPTAPAIGGALLLAGAFAERTTRVRGRTARAVHVLVALVGGALAGVLSTTYLNAALPVYGIAILCAAVLASLPLLVDADDPIAHALEEAADLVDEPAKRSLRAGAELRRQSEEIPLDRATMTRVKTTWQSLLRLAEARIRMERTRPQTLLRLAAETTGTSAEPTAADAVLGMVDQRIAEHVAVLARAYTAVDTVSAARIGLDDAALKNVENGSESLEEVSRAMVSLSPATDSTNG